VFLSEPGRTEYDLNFNFLGFHVRAHPFFFLVCLFIGNNIVRAAGVNTGVGVLMGVLVFFVSILIHEIGHSLAHRRYGMGSRIVLYAMGGMAVGDIDCRPLTAGADVGLRSYLLSEHSRVPAV